MEHDLLEERARPVRTRFELAVRRMMNAWLAAGRIRVSPADVKLACEYLENQGCRVEDAPGALFNILSPFARHGISMNRIESRPSHVANWEYAFFIDLAGHVEDVQMKKALAELEPKAASIRVLGSYPVAVL